MIATILILEDNDQLLGVEIEILTSMGYNIVGAKTIDEAVSLSQKMHVDMFLVDYMTCGGFYEPKLRSLLTRTNKQAKKIFISSLGKQPVPADWADFPFVLKSMDFVELGKLIHDTLADDKM